jgi:hypothetical protein
MDRVLATKFKRGLGQHSEKFRRCDELCSGVTPLAQEFLVGCDQIGGLTVYCRFYQPPVALVPEGYIFDGTPLDPDRSCLQLLKQGFHFGPSGEALEPF